jgi:predicted unusual protein kinase regulating ubiquinone biosynthesis (AarF/ABC1/UbiB family)
MFCARKISVSYTGYEGLYVTDATFHNKLRSTVKQTTLEKLKRYDYAAIARHYRQRPWLPLFRALQVFWWFAGFALGVWFDLRKGTEEQNRPRRAIQLREIITKLGPGTIKIGQALSTRPDLIPAAYMEELTILQDQLPPFDNAIAFASIKEQLGKDPREIYAEFSPEPVAAASLGQVYKAKLKSGEVVAVKVQRPNLVRSLTLDLFVLRWAAGWIAPYLPLNLGHDLSLIVDEFGSKLFEEIDYQQEGRNCNRFAEYFKNDPRIYAPKIYWDYSARRVLTLEWIDGIKLNDIEGIRRAGLSTDNLIRLGVESGLKQLLEFGFFHADPHPGNLFALRDGRMAYIDFGMMDQLPESLKEGLIDALVHLLNKDYDELAESFKDLGFLAPEVDISPIVPALERVLGDILGAKVSEFNIKTITDQFSELMFDYPFRVPAQFALIIRSLVTQEGVALSLDPEFSLVSIGYPYVARRLLTDESPRLRERLLRILFKHGRFQWHRLENLLRIAGEGAADSEIDLIPSAQLAFQYLTSPEGRFIREQVVNAFTEGDQLHTREVTRLWELIRPQIQPQRLVTSLFTGVVEQARKRVTAAVLPR